MPMLIDRETALRRLGPDRLELLGRCFERAWERYEEVIRPELPLCHPTPQAGILREFIINEVRDAFPDLPGVTIRDHDAGGRFLLEIDGVLMIQFKKLTTDFQTRNYPTPTSEAFDQQRELDGFPALPRLTAGYQMGQYGTELASVSLAFLVGSECVWHHDIQSGEHSVTLEFPHAAGPSPADQEEEAKRRVQTEGTSRAEEGA